MAGLQVARDAGDQRRRLHRGDQMVEEALLGGFESAARRRFGLGVQGACRAGDVGGLHRPVEIIMDDLKRTGIAVVDADLSGRQDRKRTRLNSSPQYASRMQSS